MLNASTSRSLAAMPSLDVQWEGSCALVNLRIHALDALLREALAVQARIKLPEHANTTVLDGNARSIWAGPDDWFVMDEASPCGQTFQLQEHLQAALRNTHHAITDVSSGYRRLTMRGCAAREVLARCSRKAARSICMSAVFTAA